MDINKSIQYLKHLEKNNNRDWFHANKDMYNEAKSEFEAFIDDLIPKVYKIDNEVGSLAAKDCIFRIFRDVRFSKNKLPYKTNFGAFISKGGRKSPNAGYYFHMEPGGSFLGGGVYCPQPAYLKGVRQEIYYNVPEFKKIISGKNFTKFYDGISEMDDKLKKAPKGFPADFEDIELLRHKHYTCFHNVADKIITSDELSDYIIKAFKAMKEFNGFINRGIENIE